MPAFAHKINIFAWVEGETVHTESYFPDGRVVQNGTVSVYDSKDSILLKGVTDQEGLFSFPVPKRDDLTIVLDTSMGHNAIYHLSAEELSGGEANEAHGGHQRPRKRVSVGKILCGIGYIMGIMGLSMYFYEKGKKKKKGLGSG
jgi:nickel transport protein